MGKHASKWKEMDERFSVTGHSRCDYYLSVLMEGYKKSRLAGWLGSTLRPCERHRWRLAQVPASAAISALLVQEELTWDLDGAVFHSSHKELVSFKIKASLEKC